MRHLPVLLYILSLLCGVVCLTVLGSRYARYRDRRSVAALFFFGSYSLLVAVMTVFAYVFTNLSDSPGLAPRFAAAVIAAMVPVQISQPVFVFADYDRIPGLRASLLIGFGAAVTAASSFAVLALSPLFSDAVSVYFAIPAFCSFGLTMVASLFVVLRNRSARGSAPSLRRFPVPSFSLAGAYIALIGFALYEFLTVTGEAESAGWRTVSLPLLYMLTAFQFTNDAGRNRNAGPSANGLRSNPDPAAEGGASAIREIPSTLARRHRLTPRETEMGRLILSGLGNKEIADILGISENTVRNHIYSLYQKLGIQKRMDLVSFLSKNGTKIPDGNG